MTSLSPIDRCTQTVAPLSQCHSYNAMTKSQMMSLQVTGTQ